MGTMTNERIRLTKDVFRIDAEAWCREIEDFIRMKFSESCRDGIVVTVSGGLDSSVVASLCVRAIGKDKVKGLMLPERGGNPEAVHYGRILARHLGIEMKRIGISPVLRGLGTSNYLLSIVSGRTFWTGVVNRFMQKRGHSIKTDYMDALQGKLGPSTRKLVAQINSKHRARVLVAYKFAEENNLLVAGSAHRTEKMVGLFCKYGIDDCADLMPLKNIYRSHILQLAGFLGVPSEIIYRSPNPDIIPGVTDKYRGYFGLDSLQVDLILWGLQKGMAVHEIADQLGIREQKVSQMREVIRLSENTRNHAQAPILKY